MGKKIDAKFREHLTELWADEYIRRGRCGLCGNNGIVDTRGRAISPTGVDCGDRFFCICPNGRIMAAAPIKVSK